MLKKHVIVELRVPRKLHPKKWMEEAKRYLHKKYGFKLDLKYFPRRSAFFKKFADELKQKEELLIFVRGKIRKEHLQKLRALEKVAAIWSDPRIRVFDYPCGETQQSSPCRSTCYTLSSAKGTLEDVISHLDAKWVWAQNQKGQGVVIGVCDTGVMQSWIGVERFQTKPNSTEIDGWTSEDYQGLDASPGSDLARYPHGTSLAYDLLHICPEAKILDIGLFKPDKPFEALLSDAEVALDWAIEHYQDPTLQGPHVILCSWGMVRKDDIPPDPTGESPNYADNPDHPFTRTVQRAIAAGILVCFAAGNCGEVNPTPYCGSVSEGNIGPNQSIWGANGHEAVICVGAATTENVWVGCSSQGPSALGAEKPDVVAPSDFQGFISCDRGTSTANAILAGVLGLLKGAIPDLQQDEARDVLICTATDVCGPGWNPQGGNGMINAKAALTELWRKRGQQPPDPNPPNLDEIDGYNPPEPPIIKGPCSITTATGNPHSIMNPQIQYLREYRDDVILQSNFSSTFKRLEDIYYRLSSSFAMKMKKSSVVRKIVSVFVVFPFIGLVKGLLSLKLSLRKSG